MSSILGALAASDPDLTMEDRWRAVAPSNGQFDFAGRPAVSGPIDPA
ncbi:MAG TPA: hypothetical protein VGJ34_09135 [Gaiellaceae bacterium]|jgi:hypothetical protein